MCFFLKKTDEGSVFGGCSHGVLYTDGIPCHHMVAVVKSLRIEGLTATNSMPVWWSIECWHNQYPADTNETCHFDIDVEIDTGRCSNEVLPAICCTQKSRMSKE